MPCNITVPQLIVIHCTYCSSGLSAFSIRSSTEDSYGTILDFIVAVFAVSAFSMGDGDVTGELYGVLLVSAAMGKLSGELSLGNKTPSDSSSSVADCLSSE